MVNRDFDSEKKVFYLLLYVGDTLISHPRLTYPFLWKTQQKAQKAATNAGLAVGIKISTILLKEKACQELRYFFRFARYRRDDSKAQRFAESFVCAVELLCGPIANYAETSMIFPIPADMVRNKTVILFDDIHPSDLSGLVPLRKATFLLPDIIEVAWKITPVIFSEDDIHMALLFLRSSQHHFYSVPPLRSHDYDPDSLAESSLVQTHWENCLQNSYKAVEAIIGDLPKGDAKFFARLRSIGLDPAEEVGYVIKRPLQEELRAMRLARDKKSAHGGTPKRQIKVGEAMNYQECAKYVIEAAIDTKLGEPTLFKRSNNN